MKKEFLQNWPQQKQYVASHQQQIVNSYVQPTHHKFSSGGNPSLTDASQSRLVSGFVAKDLNPKYHSPSKLDGLFKSPNRSNDLQNLTYGKNSLTQSANENPMNAASKDFQDPNISS